MLEWMLLIDTKKRSTRPNEGPELRSFLKVSGFPFVACDEIVERSQAFAACMQLAVAKEFSNRRSQMEMVCVLALACLAGPIGAIGPRP